MKRIDELYTDFFQSTFIVAPDVLLNAIHIPHYFEPTKLFLMPLKAHCGCIEQKKITKKMCNIFSRPSFSRRGIITSNFSNADLDEINRLIGNPVEIQ